MIFLKTQKKTLQLLKITPCFCRKFSLCHIYELIDGKTKPMPILKFQLDHQQKNHRHLLA